MTAEVFKRYENKYLLDEKTFARIQNRLADNMEPDAYNKKGKTYAISNLYYDTEDSSLIRTSLSKPKYKEKLRLRAYGTPDSDSLVYVEIKKKVNGLVSKRRSVMKLSEAYDFLSGGEEMTDDPHESEEGTCKSGRNRADFDAPEISTPQQTYMNRQVNREIEYILERNTLLPVLYLAYDRRAYFGAGQHDLRVSFDTNIRTRRSDLRLEAGDYGERLLGDGVWLMEIKVAQSIPIWLCKLLSDNKVYPASFSKYGAEYQRFLKRKRKIIYITMPGFARGQNASKTQKLAISNQ